LDGTSCPPDIAVNTFVPRASLDIGLAEADAEVRWSVMRSKAAKQQLLRAARSRTRNDAEWDGLEPGTHVDVRERLS
jgi:hypothetical protein